MIKQHTLNLARLRRCDVFDQVTGGCVSVEITNESRGWHLHAHWLVDARWVSAKELSKTWGRLVGQDYAIVKVIDVIKHTATRAGAPPNSPPQNYERELMKYVVKGSDLARWKVDQLYEFINAVRGQRFFFAFGELFKVARTLRAQAAADKPPTTPCECGSCQFIFTTEQSRKKRQRRLQAK